jgi:hypothetical protein
MASKITQSMREQVLADYDACKHIATVAKQNGLSEPTIRKIIVQERGENAISHTRGAASASVTARCTATNEEISQIVRESFQYFKRSCVKTDEECADKLNDYFKQCVEEGQIPTVEDMCLALGAVTQTVLDWQNGSLGPVRAGMIKKAKQILAGIDVKLVSQGKIRKANGKVIGEFACERIVPITYDGGRLWCPTNAAFSPATCLSQAEIIAYIGDKGRCYGWHISDLLIYDQPRELTAFRRLCPNDLYCEACAMYSNNNGICNNGALPLRRPPQSWCYVEEVLT